MHQPILHVPVYISDQDKADFPRGQGNWKRALD